MTGIFSIHSDIKITTILPASAVTIQIIPPGYLLIASSSQYPFNVNKIQTTMPTHAIYRLYGKKNLFLWIKSPNHINIWANNAISRLHGKNEIFVPI